MKKEIFKELFFKIPRQLVMTIIICFLIQLPFLSIPGALAFLGIRMATNEIFDRDFEKIDEMEWKM